MAEEQAGQGRRLRAPWGRLVTWLASAQREAWGVGGVGWDGTTAQRVSGGSGQGAGGRRPTLAGHLVTRLASAQREAWGVGGWGMAAERRQSLRAVAGAEAITNCAYTRGFQIRA